MPARTRIREMMRPGMRQFNTFVYTGAFSIAVATGGAETTTLDLSQPYLDWAKRNFSHNGMDPANHHATRLHRRPLSQIRLIGKC